MRVLLSLAVVAALPAFASADDAPQYFLIDGKVTTAQRVTTLEKEVAELKAEIAALKKACAKPAAAVGRSACGCADCACQPAPGGVGTCGSYSCSANGGSLRASLPATITTTDGCTYTRGADGEYRPVGSPSGFAGSACSGPSCGRASEASFPGYSAPIYPAGYFGGFSSLPSYSPFAPSASCAGGSCGLR